MPSSPAAVETARPIAVVLLSGGLDSCVAAAIAAQEHALALLHVNYRQRTEARELQSFHAIADRLHAAHRLVVELPSVAEVGGSSLVEGGPAVPAASFAVGEVPSTYVPFRNGQLLAIAVGWAEVLAARAIFVGAVEQDSSGYPDCRRPFFDAFEQAADLGTRPETRLRVVTPLIDLGKPQIVQQGLALGAPLELTWSCYQDNELACGVCESCLLRLRGFVGAGVPDPIPYRRRG
ncbi:MAG: 7-cyano-7-deazaguanine synthase QueC [Deltaproteobacteria bacterium]|nr:7-cyano-7-deazaguanine synthase QueC [Deltaproteobacteria bacterium]